MPGWTSQRERGWILLAVALWHVAVLFALRAAMHGSVAPLRDAETPLQITIIERRAASILPDAAIAPQPHVAKVSASRRAIVRSDALQAVAIERQPKPLDSAEPAHALLYQADGGLRLPAAPSPPQVRDLLAHRSMSGMLPGGDRAFAPELQVSAGLSPQKLVERVGMLFGGGHFDPCPQFETELANADGPDAREQAMERLERSCPGR